MSRVISCVFCESQTQICRSSFKYSDVVITSIALGAIALGLALLLTQTSLVAGSALIAFGCPALAIFGVVKTITACYSERSSSSRSEMGEEQARNILNLSKTFSYEDSFTVALGRLTHSNFDKIYIYQTMSTISIIIFDKDGEWPYELSHIKKRNDEGRKNLLVIVEMEKERKRLDTRFLEGLKESQPSLHQFEEEDNSIYLMPYEELRSLIRPACLGGKQFSPSLRRLIEGES